MAGEIERRRQPNPSQHIELPTAPFVEQRYRGDGPLKRLRVRRDAVADPTKVGEIESHRPQKQARPRRPKDAPTTTKDDWLLPDENGGEPQDPDDREEQFVAGE